MSDLAQAVWVDPTGTEWVLTDNGIGWATTNAVSGLGAVPIEQTTDPSPRGGSVLRHTQPLERIIIWPLHIWGNDHMEFITRYRNLADAFTRTDEDGPGKLIIYRPDGTSREISAYYQAGFDNEPGRGYLDDNVALALYCPQPWFYDREETVIYRAYEATGDFLSPLPTISSSLLLGESEVVNPGSAVAWPEWTITGPAEYITATNLTTGESWELDPDAPGIDHGPLLAGQTITLKTEELQVRGPNGVDIWTGAINFPEAALWGLRRGVNLINFDVQGAEAGTEVTVRFRAKHRTA